jgi:hypothetical protein
MARTEEKNTALHIDDTSPDDSQQVAAHATDFEDHDATIWQTVTGNPWACFWSFYACWTIVLVAFETQASGAVVGIPEFRKDFGFEFPAGSGTYVIPAEWQSAFNGAPQAAYGSVQTAVN